MDDEALEDALRLVEAYLFASPEPVGTDALMELPGLAAADVGAVLEALADRYRGRGIRPVEVAGGWQFRTAPDLAPRLGPVLRQTRRLPQAAMEVLATIAQRQPITRAEVEQVRGAATGPASFELLLDLGLIAPAGRAAAPGRPTLWQTTPAFLAHFGLRSLRDLPGAADLAVPPPHPADDGGVAAAGGDAPGT